MFPFQKGGGFWCQQANFKSCHAGKFTFFRHLEWARSKTTPKPLKLLLPCKNNGKTCFLVPVVLFMLKYWNWIILSSPKKNLRYLGVPNRFWRKIWCFTCWMLQCAVTLKDLKWDFWMLRRRTQVMALFPHMQCYYWCLSHHRSKWYPVVLLTPLPSTQLQPSWWSCVWVRQFFSLKAS